MRSNIKTYRDVDIVENAYTRILQYEQLGLLKINHFEELSDAQIRKNKNMVIGAIKRFGRPPKILCKS